MSGGDILELDQGGETRLLLAHRRPVLPGLRIARMGFFDALFASGVSEGGRVGLAWHMSAEEPALLAMLLATTRVADALDACLALPATLWVDGQGVWAALPRRHLGQRAALIDAMRALETQLAEGPTEQWSRCARSLQLSLTWNGQSWLTLSAQGEVRGVPVHVGIAPGNRMRPLVRATIPATLPRDFRVVSKGTTTVEPLGRVRLRDPILSAYIKVYAVNMEEARRIVEGHDLHGPLLAVLHGRPGSSVEDGAVLVYGDDLLAAGLQAAVDDAVNLAAALAEASEASFG